MNKIVDSFYFSTILGSPVRPEDLKQSQYFDALETIKEEIDETDHHHQHVEETDQHHQQQLHMSSDEETESESEGDWTDLSDEDEKPKFKENVKIGRGHRSKKNLPEVVQRRVKALKKSQFEMEMLEAKFYRELFYLESEFNLTQREPIHEKRNQIINTIDSHGVRLENFW